MPQISEVQRVKPGADLKSFSCLTCRQRKIKCDRQSPCSNCTKATRQCSFIPPVRGKPKRRKTPKEGLHAKLRRYEEMLRAYGADIEPSDNGHISDGETMSDADVEMTELAESRDKSSDHPPLAFDEDKMRLITKNGSSRYFDNGLWSNIGDEYQHPEEVGMYEKVAGSKGHEPDVLIDACDENALVLSTFSKVESLTGLHFPFHILQKMLDIYIDRADPLMKLLHIPTFWSTVTNAFQHPDNMSKSLEALIFAFYLVIIRSMEENECYNILGEQKPTMSTRYEIAARQALINARFLKSSSSMTLQAYVIFLMGMKTHYESDSLFILSGIAVRLARRMGLHRDGTSLGLSPFETEMRRRLWWHIVQIDSRISDYSGTKPSMDLFLSDTKIPLNVEDEDLWPDMANSPPERAGITPIVLCLIRCDVMGLLRKFTPQFSYDIRWENLSNTSITLPEKDNMINEMEDLLERKYLRYHDPTNPLHLFSSIMARYSICKMRIFAHSPRQFASRGVKVPQKARDIIFANGMKLLEYGNWMHSNQILKKFMWQIGTGYLWDTLLFVLIEARHRKRGPEVDRAWQLIGGVYQSYPRIFADSSEALYAAIGNWTLHVWDDCAAARRVEGVPESPAPDYITALRHFRKSRTDSFSKSNELPQHAMAMGDLTGFGEAQSIGVDGNSITNSNPLDSYDFSNLLSFDLEPNEWAQWERLFAGMENVSRG